MRHSESTASDFNATSPLVALYTSTDREKQRFGSIFISISRSPPQDEKTAMQIIEIMRADVMKKLPQVQLVEPAREIKVGNQVWAVAVFMYNSGSEKIFRALYITKLPKNTDVIVDAMMVAPVTENTAFFTDIKKVFDQMINTASFDTLVPTNIQNNN